MNSSEHGTEKHSKTPNIINTCQTSVQFPEIDKWGEFESQRQGLILSRNKVQLHFQSLGGKAHQASNNISWHDMCPIL